MDKLNLKRILIVFAGIEFNTWANHSIPKFEEQKNPQYEKTIHAPVSAIIYLLWYTG